jgi:hypothetical protein
VRHQVGEDVEHLRLDVDLPARRPQLEHAGVELEPIESVPHRAECRAADTSTQGSGRHADYSPPVEQTVFLAVVGARFLVPLLIPRFPLPAILAALVLDGVDQTIFQALGYDPPGYQGYDKAMDVYYLAIAYLSTLRNWTSEAAVRVAGFLYFYRLVGVIAFEETQWRPFLLIFPNVFEYFFIVYEAYRLRRDPARVTFRAWVVTAAVIWIGVKLPQEYWIHIAQLDLTDLLSEEPWFGVVLAGLAALAVAGLWFGLRPRLPEPDRRWAVRADPLPHRMDSAGERDRWFAAHGHVLSLGTAEKVALVGGLSVIFGEVLPDLRATGLELFVGMAVFVVVNAAITLLVARRLHSLRSSLAAFAARVLLNVALVVVASWLLRRDERDINEATALFFVLLLCLITLLDDRYRPVHAVRVPDRPRITGHTVVRPRS